MDGTEERKDQADMEPEERIEQVSAESLISTLAKELESNFLFVRLNALKECEETLLASKCETLTRPETRALVQVLIGSTIHPTYLEPAFQKEVERVFGKLVSVAGENETVSLFPQVAGAALAGECAAGAAAPRAAAAALRLARELLARAPLGSLGEEGEGGGGGGGGGGDGVPEWVEKLVAALAGVLERLLRERRSGKFRRAAAAQTARLWRARPPLAGACLRVWTTHPDCRGKSWQGQRCLALACTGGDLGRAPALGGPRAAAVLGRLLEVYAAEAFSAKSGADEHSLAAYGALLATLTREQYLEAVHPAVEKALKKNPEAALPAVAALTDALRLDLGPQALAYVGPALKQCRSAKDHVRPLGLAVVASLGRLCGDEGTLLAMVEEVAGVLAGKAGVLGQWHQRLFTAAALRALLRAAAAAGPGGRGALAGTAAAAAAALGPLLAKEAHEPTRLLAFATLGEAVALMDRVPDDIISILLDGLKTTDPAKCTAPLLAAAALVDAAPAALAPLLAPLRAVVGAAQARPAQTHPHGALALRCLVALAEATGTTADLPWEVLARGTSFLHGASLLATPPPGAAAPPAPPEVDLGAEAAAAACAALGAAAALDPRALGLGDQEGEGEGGEPSPPPPPAAVTLVAGLLHPAAGARAAARAAVRHMQRPGPLLAALELAAAAAAAADLGAAAAGGEEAAAAAAAPPTGRVAAALKACLAAGGAAAAEGEGEGARARRLLPRALLLAHHPAAAPSVKAAGRLWGAACDRALGGYAGAQAALAGEGTAAAAAALLGRCLGAEEAAARLAGQRALATLGGDCGEVGFNLAKDRVLPGLLRQLQLPRREGVTDHDVAVYFHPPGSLYAAPAKKKEITKNVNKERKRTKGNKGAYDVEDEEWELQFKKEKEAKEKAGPDPEEAAALAAEAATRARVGALRRAAAAALDSLACAVRDNLYLGQLAVSEALPALLGLLETPLLRAEAAEALRGLAGALADPALADWALETAGALRLVHLAGEEAEAIRAAAATKVVYKVLNRVAKRVIPLYSGPKPLDPASFFFVFPVLRASLLAPPTTAAAQQALGIISAHASMPDDGDESLPGHALVANTALRSLRKDIIAIVLHTLEALPKMEPSPAKVLTKACTGPPLTQGEWGPLLGDAGLLSPEKGVRQAVLETVLEYAMEGGPLGRNPVLECRLWLARHDAAPEVVELAEDIWEARGEPLAPVYAPLLLALLGHDGAHVRRAAGRALAGGALAHPRTLGALRDRLLATYARHRPEEEAEAKSEAEKMEAFLALPIGQEAEAKSKTDEFDWRPRSGVALAVAALGELRALEGAEGGEEHLMGFLDFLVRDGVTDPDAAVRREMTEAGVALVVAYGPAHGAAVLARCDRALHAAAAPGEGVAAFDRRREGAVVLTGRCARFLDPGDPQIEGIVGALLAALATPSEAVQRAVADCLVPLVKVPAVKGKAPGYLEALMETVVKGERYGDRRGAAFGVAALVKGVGISALKKENIIAKCEEACGRGPYTGKQGALMVFECLCLRLGMLFEPYIIAILPLLLKCFSDTSDHVREASFFTAQAIMANLSQHGVKLVLPAILRSLDDKAWRTKHAALQLLGAMGACAPRQLGQCLPQVVPKLSEAFADTHVKVKAAAKKALADIGKVVSNPEVSRLSPQLMEALADPANKTKDALQSMLQCEFVHAIDAPSLALLVPVMRRGLKDRSAEAKKKAALITGNMCQMVADPKDFVPYLDRVLPALKEVLVDPVPDVRATAAHALGAMVKGVGQERMGALVPWLALTLKSEASPVERSGGAQGLAEVLAVLGPEATAPYLEELLPLHRHPGFAVREGVLWLLSYLPAALQAAYARFVPAALPVVLAGLADDVESVRAVALTAGQVLVRANGKEDPQLLLPTLERGLFDANWRIRQASVALLSSLLDLLGGIRAAGLPDAQRRALLAALYVIRSDVSGVVRQAALAAWKELVANTPRTLREIMPVLIDLLVTSLSEEDADKRTVAGRALGDLVKKLGEQVLPAVVPHLRAGLERGSPATRQGVCLGLAEILECAHRRQIEEFLQTLVPAVQDALCDPAPAVREQAAAAFQTLYRVVGPRATDEVLPALLKALRREAAQGRPAAAAAEEEEGEEGGARLAVYGLREVLRLRPRELLAYVLPKVLAHPMQVWQARVLGAVAEAAPTTIHFSVGQIVPCLVREVSEGYALAPDDTEGLERRDAAEDAFRALLGSVDTVGVNFTVSELVKYVGSAESAAHRRAGAWAVEQFLLGTRADFAPQIPILLRDLLQRMHEEDDAALTATHRALQALNKAAGAEELAQHLEFARTLLASLVSDKRWKGGALAVGEGEFLLRGTNVPPRGLEPLLPMYLQGLMYGAPQVREAAAAGLGELVQVTGAPALKPFLVKITGPLIRIVGDRFPPGVKAAILKTLGLLLGKGGVMLKPFVPQLQTTFVKALGDPDRAVRAQGAEALARLMAIATRVDPLVAELLAGAQTGEPAVRATMLGALRGVLLGCAGRAVPSPPALAEALAALAGLLGEGGGGGEAEAAARALGAAARHLDADAAADLVRGPLAARGAGAPGGAAGDAGRCLALGHAARARAGNGGDGLLPALGDALAVLAQDGSSDSLPVRAAAAQGFRALLVACASQEDGGEGPAGAVMETAVPILVALLSDGPAEARKPAALAAKTAAKLFPALTAGAHLAALVPPLLKVVKDPNLQTKLLSERALMHVLQIHTRPDTLSEFVAGAAAEDARFVRDYARRVLARLKADLSDEEED